MNERELLASLLVTEKNKLDDVSAQIAAMERVVNPTKRELCELKTQRRASKLEVKRITARIAELSVRVDVV